MLKAILVGSLVLAAWHGRTAHAAECEAEVENVQRLYDEANECHNRFEECGGVHELECIEIVDQLDAAVSERTSCLSGACSGDVDERG